MYPTACCSTVSNVYVQQLSLVNQFVFPNCACARAWKGGGGIRLVQGTNCKSTYALFVGKPMSTRESSADAMARSDAV